MVHEKVLVRDPGIPNVLCEVLEKQFLVIFILTKIERPVLDVKRYTIRYGLECFELRLKIMGGQFDFPAVVLQLCLLQIVQEHVEYGYADERAREQYDADIRKKILYQHAAPRGFMFHMRPSTGDILRMPAAEIAIFAGFGCGNRSVQKLGGVTSYTV
jgi:hypothetical protein